MTTARSIRTVAAVVAASLLLALSAAMPATAKGAPRVDVQASLQHVYASANVVVSDLGTPSSLTWRLIGPLAEVNESCYGLDWSGAPEVHSAFMSISGDGIYPIRPFHVDGPGCYTYSVRVWETSTTEEVVFAAGLETIRYSPLGPSAPGPTVPAPSYPIDRGVVTLISQNAPGSPVFTLQETGNVYYYHPDARNVVGSPGSWNLTQQRWRLIQTGVDTYRFLNVESGRALQATNNRTDLPLHEANDPRYTSPRFNVVTTPASWNLDQQQIRVERIAGGDGTQVTLWGKVGTTEQRIEVTPIGYLDFLDVWLVGTGPGSTPWTVSGYTFPR